ncbi:MAG TPA: hypothetical protein VK459_28030 [Polyangiaceae bacterium]|jgi:hypothetical protein|nr:hypothetical protein [Polyangiaceae bacterium]
MESLTSGELSIDVAETSSPPRIQLFWKGRSREREPRATLLPFFAAALARAVAHQAALELHFKGLDYWSSSTITCVIHLIQDARGQGVKVVLLYNPSHKWQKLSFEALRALAKNDGLLEIRAAGELEGEPGA